MSETNELKGEPDQERDLTIVEDLTEHNQEAFYQKMPLQVLGKFIAEMKAEDLSSEHQVAMRVYLTRQRDSDIKILNIQSLVPMAICAAVFQPAVDIYYGKVKAPQEYLTDAEYSLTITLIVLLTYTLMGYFRKEIQDRFEEKVAPYLPQANNEEKL